jgi:hypothetical protein
MLLLLRDLIHERLGTFFDESRLDVMAEKLEEPAKSRHCRSLLDYYYLLKYDADNQAEWEKVMDSLSVQETYFWREMSQVEAVVKFLVPAWFMVEELWFAPKGDSAEVLESFREAQHKARVTWTVVGGAVAILIGVTAPGLTHSGGTGGKPVSAEAHP